MLLLALIVVVLVAGTTATVLKRRRQARQSTETPVTAEPATPATDTATAVAEQEGRTFVARLRHRVASMLPGLPSSWRSRMRGRSPRQTREQFNTWLARTCADEASLGTWFQQLTEKDAQTFIDQLSAFCQDKGIELPWVVEHHLEPYSALAQAANEVVLCYCRACHQAVTARQELDVYKTLLAFERNPADVKAHEFGHKLFARVMEAGLTSVSLSEYLLATPKAQHQDMLRAIHEAAERHRETFIRLLQELAKPAASPAAAATFTSGEQENAPASATTRENSTTNTTVSMEAV